MASIIDSFRETFGDSLAFFKLLVFAVPLYFSYDLLFTSKNDPTGFIWLLSITIFFLFGFLIRVTSGVLNEKDSVLPPINPLQLATSSLKGLIAIGPITILSIFIANYFASIINIVQWFDITMESLIWLLAISISLTSFLMFVRRESIADAYNLKTLSDKAPDLMIALIFFVIQLVVVNIPTTIFLGYVLFILFGAGPILNFYIAVAIVFNVGVTGHYLAQLQYEIIGYDRENF